MIIIFGKSNRKEKKFKVVIHDGKTKRTVHFGGEGYEDYTTHNDKKRLQLYDNRHKKNENWDKSGIKTSGFWAKWMLWNKPTIDESIKDIEKRFGVNIIKE